MFKFLFNNRFSNRIRSDLSKAPKTYWFGWMAFGLTIYWLVEMLLYPSEYLRYLHFLTPPFTLEHLSILGVRIGPIIIFALLYMKERIKRERINKTYSGASEICSGGWDPPGCGAPNYPYQSSHSTTSTCDDCGTKYRNCVGHTCEDGGDD